jgi:hypothetical protein
MGAGGIVQKAKVLLVAVTDPSFYLMLPPERKAAIDAIDAKDPASRTQEDVDVLLTALNEANGC